MIENESLNSSRIRSLSDGESGRVKLFDAERIGHRRLNRTENVFKIERTIDK